MEYVVAENVIQFDRKLKVMDLQASNGWLCPWKERSGISFEIAYGDSWNDVKMSCRSSLLNYLDLLKDIFNGNQLYLFNNAYLAEFYIFSQEDSLIGNRLKALNQ